MPPQKPLSGAGGSWDGPDLPIPPGLQPGNEPSETAIPRAIDAIKERVPTTIPGVIKSALGSSFGEGGVSDEPADNTEHSFSSMGRALKQAGSTAKTAYTTKTGLKNVGKTAGSDIVTSVTGLQPRDYAEKIQQGDYAGAGAGFVVDAAQTAAAMAAHEPGARLAGEHPAIAEQALNEHMEKGGSTFDPRTGRNLSGTNNWSVGVAPEHSVVSTQAPTPEVYSQFVSQNSDLFRRNPNLHVGTWYDDQTGLHHMDIVATTSNKEAAVQMGKHLGEKSIYHLGRGELLETTPQPERPLAPGHTVETYPWMGHEEFLVHDDKGNVITHSHLTEADAIKAANEAVGFNQRPPLTGDVESRAQALHQATPARQPFQGYHMANEKLDYIDGNRRGMIQPTGRPVGQEAARLNLKTDTGVGQNAPAGFYAYSAGTRPEPSIAGRKYSHEVRGNFAMADVTDPRWDDAAKAAYDEAFQKTGNATVAQYAATNAKEHAIRDAGYDGYTAPGTGINFFFDGKPTRLVGAPVKEAAGAGGRLASEAGVARTEAARKGLGGNGSAAAAAPAPDVAQKDPWANLKYDRQATDQAMSEAQNGQLPQGMTIVQRAQQIKEHLMSGNEQGGHAGNGVASVEEINRPGKNFLLDKNGKLTYHGKSFAPEETPAGGAHVTVMDDGQYRLNEGTELNPAQKNALSRAAKELGIKELRPQGEGSSSVQSLREASNAFNKERGRGAIDTKPVEKDSRAADIADAFDKMKHAPNDPAGAQPGEFAEQKAGLLPEWAYKRTNGASLPGENSASVQNGDPLSLLSDKERDQAMSKRLGNQFTQILRKIPAVQDFEAAARKGASGRTWYQRSVDAFDEMRKLAPDYFKPEDADKFANVVAATSPQQGVPLNLREALTFWKDWHDAGRPTSISDIQKAMRNGDIRPLTNQPSKLGNVVLALNDHDILEKTINKGELTDRNKYFKVGNFGKNLSQSFKNVTLDSWMGNFANVGEQDVAKPQFYHALALRTRQAAQKLGWHPAEAQAAIWTFTKTLAEMSGWKVAGGKYYRPTEMLDRLTPDKMKAYSNDFADIMKTDPEVRAKLSELGVDLNELDKRLKNITPKPQGEALEGADKEALARSLRRNAARIGRSQRKLEGFTQYTRPPAQSELDLGAPDEGDTSFPFGGPLADAIRAGR